MPRFTCYYEPMLFIKQHAYGAKKYKHCLNVWVEDACKVLGRGFNLKLEGGLCCTGDENVLCCPYPPHACRDKSGLQQSPPYDTPPQQKSAIRCHWLVM